MKNLFKICFKHVCPLNSYFYFDQKYLTYTQYHKKVIAFAYRVKRIEICVKDLNMYVYFGSWQDSESI